MEKCETRVRIITKDYGDTTPVKVGERVKHRYFEADFTLPVEAQKQRVFLSSKSPLRGIMLNGRVVNVPDLVREIDVTGLLDLKGRNLLRWVDGTLHGISSEMLDKPNDAPLNEMRILLK